MGVSIDQWRGRIGRFNVLRSPNRTFISRCRTFLILSHLMVYSKFLRDYLFFPFLIFQNILLLFCFCFTAITLLSLSALFRLGIWFFKPGVFPSRWDIFITLRLVFTFPRLISLLNTKCYHMFDTMDNNTAFRLLVINMLLLMAGIESNPGPSMKKIFRSQCGILTVYRRASMLEFPS